MNDLTAISGKLEPLDDYEPDGLELSPEYWTPSEKGESRRVYYAGIANYNVPSAEDPDVMVDLECIVFVEVRNNVHSVIINGSKRLLGTIRDNEKVKPGAALQVTYRGEVANKQNAQRKGADWSVVLLKKKGS